MTSQKSLKNNVNLNDFKRSLLEPMVFGLIAFGVLFFTTTYTVIDFVTDPQNISAFADIYQMFMSGRSMFGSGSQTYLFAGMVFCGLLMAYKSFRYLLSKKRVNVYLSFGVTRRTMFVNRILSSVLWLFASSFLPIFITYMVNIATFGATKLMFNTFLYFSSALFISGLAGLAIGSFAIMISGNLFDFSLVVLSLSVAPYCCYGFIDSLKFYWLNGSYHTLQYSPYRKVVTPLTFVTTLSTDSASVEPHEFFERVSKSWPNGVTPESMGFNINKDFIIPLLIWLAVSIVLTALAFILAKARKAEHANSFGNFPLARGIVSVFAFSIISMSVADLFGYVYTINLPILALIIIGLSLVALFIIQMIMTRRIKAFVKSLPVLAGLTVVIAIAFTVVGTEVFGTYNKVPKAEDVSSISIDLREGVLGQNLIYNGSDFIESKNPEDIKTFLEIFDDMKDCKRSKDYVDKVSFMIKDKNGDAKLRTFRVNQETYNEYLKKTVNSPFFDALLEKELIGFNDKGVSKDGNYSFEEAEIVFAGEPLHTATPDYYTKNTDGTVFVANYYDAQGIIYNNTVKAETYDEDEEFAFTVMQGDELAVALYNDLSKMTFEQIYQNTEKPVGVLGTCLYNESAKVDTVVKKYSNDYEYYIVEVDVENTDVFLVSATVNVYKEMTETLKYLSDNNATYKDQYKGEVKEILYTDAPLSATEALGTCFSNDTELIGNSKWFAASSFTSRFYQIFGEYITQDYKMYDFLKMIYTNSQHTLRTANSTDFDKILAKTVPEFYTANNNGRFVYVIYDDGTIVCRYLPEANVSVLN